MMSDRAWLVFIFMAMAAYFFVAAFSVKTFRYRYGGFRVPRSVGSVAYALVGAFCGWIAISLALKP